MNCASQFFTAINSSLFSVDIWPILETFGNPTLKDRPRSNDRAIEYSCSRVDVAHSIDAESDEEREGSISSYCPENGTQSW